MLASQVLALALASSLCAAAPEPAPSPDAASKKAVDPLWLKALAVAAANDGLLPKRMVETEKLKDVDGETLATTLSTYEVVRESPTRVVRRLIKATRDGKEITEKRQKELSEPGSDPEVFKRRVNLFLAENEGRVEVKRTDLKEAVAGVPCTAFRFTLQGEHGPVTGRAWLDDATGTPMRIEAKPLAFPDLEKVRLKAMTQRFGYRVDRDSGRWMVETLEVRTELELKKLLDTPMVVESSVRFEGYELPASVPKPK
ncbi:MAG TPA: hypothetical protein VGK67_17820 [Myxococcales bacterium]|jgi:hypothetical protein